MKESDFKRSNFEILENAFSISRLSNLVAAISHTSLASPNLNLQYAQIKADSGLTFGGGGDAIKSISFSETNSFSKLMDLSEKDSKQIEKERKKERKKLRIKLPFKNAGIKRLISGAIAGSVSRTAVAPLETVRTFLMVGDGGKTFKEVFENILKNDGWKGLFRGNGINVLRVAPSKAIELYAYDTISRHLATRPDRTPFPFPISPIAGASAGVCSTLVTYPLELLKTRLTVQRGAYKNMLDALVKICRDEGVKELYRGLFPSVIGVIPYAAANYFAYDTLRKSYRKITGKQHIGHVATLLIGSTAGAFSSTATFPLEVARKQMQVGALSGNVLFVMRKIVERNGLGGLYRGLGASCIKLVPAAGISFMCYEACKYAFINEEEDEE